jgi:hypothetical protein
MRKRCSDKFTTCASLLRERENYVKRGIRVCDRWQNSFDLFLEDMGEAPSGLTLERINNNEGYCKENCRWATTLEQSMNRRNVKPIMFMGRTMARSHWARELGVAGSSIESRIKRGQAPEAAIAALYARKLRKAAITEPAKPRSRKP